MGFAEHLERFWPDGMHEDLAPARDDVERLLPGFRVRRIGPQAPGKPWVYATHGAALAMRRGEDGAEYLIVAPHDDPALIEMLAALATVNAEPAQRLGVGSIVALGRPWTGDSAADHLLVLPPYPFGPGVEVCELEDRRILVLWLVPITATEAAYVRGRGFETFEELLRERRVNIADPQRVAVA